MPTAFPRDGGGGWGEGGDGESVVTLSSKCTIALSPRDFVHKTTLLNCLGDGLHNQIIKKKNSARSVP